MIDIIIIIIVITILFSITKINGNINISKNKNITNNDHINITNNNCKNITNNDHINITNNDYKNNQKENIDIAYLCEYINDTEIEVDINNDKKLIVGDVHGSILQLFLPLRQVGIIDTIKFENNNFIIKENKNKNNIKVIYCGDIIGRARHSLTVPMLIAFLNINNPNIIWIYGNHDTCFFKQYIFNVPSPVSIYDHEKYSIIHHKKFNELKQLLKIHILLNKYPCIYYDDEICVSHTLISIIDDPSRDLNSLNLLYNVFNNLIDEINSKIHIDKLLFSNSIDLHIIDLFDESINIFNELTNLDKIHEPNFDKLDTDSQIKFINDLAKIVDIINPFKFSNIVDQSLYWLRPFGYDNHKGLKKGEYYLPVDKYFIGHSPFFIMDEVHNINIINNKNVMKNNINRIHEKFLKTLINTDKYDYNKEIAIISNKCLYIPDFLNLTQKKYLELMEESKNTQIIDDVYFMDIGATHGLLLDEECLIGNYLCGFAIIDKNDEVRSSKLYVF